MPHRLVKPDFDSVKRDLELASHVQKSMHPSSMPEVDRYDVFAETTPVTYGNGDFYDAISVLPRQAEAGYILNERSDPEQIVFLVGDATGHGVASALVVTQIRSMLRTTVRMGVYYRVLVDCLNRQLMDDLLPEHFVTMWMGRLHIRENYIRGLSMGQAPYFFYSSRNGHCEGYGAHTPPLGIMEDFPPYDPQVFHFNPGDILLLPTDGYVETMNKKEEIYGKERLISCVEQHASLPAADLHEAIWEDMAAFANGKKPQDDRTMVIIKRVS